MYSNMLVTMLPANGQCHVWTHLNVKARRGECEGEREERIVKGKSARVSAKGEREGRKLGRQEGDK